MSTDQSFENLPAPSVVTTGMQIGRYLLGTKIGRGGFGVVFRAHDTSLDREVALKFLHAEHTATPQMLNRFLQEARSAAKIPHPGIVTVYECGQVAGTGSAADGSAYIAMELLQGESLTDRLARCGRLDPPAAMEIARQVASALEAAHRAGIVHRDLKPDNIFLVPDSAVSNGERIKVLDFGIAKLSRASTNVETQSMSVFGTPRYMPPEQCRSAAAVDQRSDIYTLGCILFELVCGKPPFAGAAGELIAQHVLVDAPSADSIDPTLPVPLVALIAELLAKEPEDRPQTMAAVQRALEKAGAWSPGIAPTLLPDAIASLPIVLPPSLSRPSGRVRAIGTSNPTTLNAATGVSVVQPQPQPRKRLAMAALGGAALAGMIAVVAVIAMRPSNDSKAPPPLPTAFTRVAAAQGSAPPLPVNKVEREAPNVEPPKVKPEPVQATAEPEPMQAKVQGKAQPPTTKPRAATGRLTIGCRAVACTVSIDGGPAIRSPVRGLELAAGRHQIAIVNRDLAIDDRFVVEVRASSAQTILKDYEPKQPEPKPEPKPDAKPRDKTINPFAKPAGQ
ncbi:MAG: protein kinase [Deltaproteobacteria bacterium]|nr:protein kinase [Deltaproteobacteria bacterium]